VNCVSPGIAATKPDGRIDVDDYIEYLRNRVSNVTTAADKLKILFEDTAWSHEIQHFHDCVCTPSGISAFITEWELIYSIYGGLKSLRLDGWAAKSPLLMERENNPRVDTVFNFYCNLIMRRVLLNGDFPASEAPAELADYDVVWGNSAVGEVPVKIPFFASRASVDGVPRCVLIPIGFRALTECRSVQTQDMVLRIFGEELVDRFHKSFGQHYEYRVVNFLITRLAKNNGLNLNEGDWGGALFRVCGAALARAWSDGFGRTPGSELIEILAELSPDQILEKSFLRQNIELAKAVSKELEYPPAPDNWGGFWIRDFAIKSFRRSIDVYESDDGNPFPADSLSWYSVLGTTLPQPLASLQSGDLKFNLMEEQEMTMRYVPNAAAWVLLRCLLEQVMFENEIVCPVLEGPYSRFLQHVRIHPHCSKGASEGGCGRFNIGDDLSKHPDCGFRSITVDLGLAKRSL
jgi:hypothetical protein